MLTGGEVNATGNATAGNVNTAGTVSATGNVTGGNISTAGEVSAGGNVTGNNLNTAGEVSATGNATAGNVNTGGEVSATGNITGGNINTAGNVTANGVLTDNYYYANGQPVDFQQAAGSNTWIQYNDNNDFGASGTFTFDSVANLLTVDGTSSTTGNVIAGNVTTAGLVTATGNVIGGNILTGGQVSATGNASANNLRLNNGTVESTALGAGIQLIPQDSTVGVQVYGKTFPNSNVSYDLGGALNYWNTLYANAGNFASSVTAAANISGGNLTTAGQVSAAGNITGANIAANGLISATGNLEGANVVTIGMVSATGNVYGGNVIAANALLGNASLSGNVTVENITANGQVSASGNVTGGNLVTGGNAAVTGTITGGEISTSGNVSATGNVTGGNLIATSNVITGNISSAGVLTITTASGDLDLDPTGNINVNNNYINNLPTPQQAYDAATKEYVDNAVSAGLTIHTPVYVEWPQADGSINATYADGGTTQVVTDISGNKTLTFSSSPALTVNDVIVFSSTTNGLTAGTPYFVYSTNGSNQVTLSAAYDGTEITTLTNGTGLSINSRANSGVGATLTNAGANAALVVDGVLMTVGKRVLVYNQTNAYENGVYSVTTVGDGSTPWVMTRASDSNRYGPKSTSELDIGDYFFVQAGNTGAGESYVLTSPNGTIIFGTTNIAFTQFSDSVVYTANTSAGLSLIGTVFNAKVDNNTTAFDGGGNIVVKASANLTTPNIGAATGTSLSVTGNITGGNILFDGGAVSGTGNVVAGNAIISGVANVTGNVTGGNVLTGGIVSASGNITGGNISTAGDLSVTGNLVAGNVKLDDTANVATLIVRTFANITATTISDSNITGALRVAGGIGVTGNVYADGLYVLGDSVLTINSTIDGGTY